VLFKSEPIKLFSLFPEYVPIFEIPLENFILIFSFYILVSHKKVYHVVWIMLAEYTQEWVTMIKLYGGIKHVYFYVCLTKFEQYFGSKKSKKSYSCISPQENL